MEMFRLLILRFQMMVMLENIKIIELLKLSKIWILENPEHE